MFETIRTNSLPAVSYPKTTSPETQAVQKMILKPHRKRGLDGMILQRRGDGFWWRYVCLPGKNIVQVGNEVITHMFRHIHAGVKHRAERNRRNHESVWTMNIRGEQ